MAPTTSVGRGERVGVSRRCPSGGWLLRALRKTSTLRPLMWYVQIIHTMTTALRCGDLSPVVIWSDGVGDLHLWEDPIHWYSSHGSPEGTAERTETGET